MRSPAWAARQSDVHAPGLLNRLRLTRTPGIAPIAYREIMFRFGIEAALKALPYFAPRDRCGRAGSASADWRRASARAPSEWGGPGVRMNAKFNGRVLPEDWARSSPVPSTSLPPIWRPRERAPIVAGGAELDERFERSAAARPVFLSGLTASCAARQSRVRT
ncbi:hypothetical protein [Sphingomonas edaphi]|uniref:hypothetical protein n=1 Tax=Sphingomonas edaphi TaxID=2315689 RepID=UPI00389A3806